MKNIWRSGRWIVYSETMMKTYLLTTLTILISVLETDTSEADNGFKDALFEMEGKKTFECNICAKVCKSKGGLTRHQNSKRNKTAQSHEKNILGLVFDQRAVDCFEEAIKTQVIQENLYKEETNSLLKVTSTLKLYQALHPVFQTFC